MEDLTERVRAAVAQQPFMTTLGVTVTHAAAGEVDLELPFDAGLTQQHGFLHAGAVAAVLDSACGYAAWSAADGEVDVLTVEYKINLLEPAVGERVLCRGRVLRRGGRLTVCRGEAHADGKLVATSTTTMAIRSR
ncbi:MAG TPA: PaaI family thioesterase [Gaiellaceae bacterium]